MKLKSPEFEDGAHMPERVGYKKQNVNPALKVEDVPENAESLVLVMDDPDAVEPAGKVWDHWTVWNIDPGKQRIREGEPLGTMGMTDFGERGYGGPDPPDRTHVYRFRIFAVDRELELSPDTGKEEVLDGIEDHILDQAELEGKYDPV